MTKNLHSLAIRASARLSTSFEFFENRPIKEFLSIIEELVKWDKEERQKRRT